MNMDTRVGIDCGGQAGWRGTKRKNWDNYNSTINKIF